MGYLEGPQKAFVEQLMWRQASDVLACHPYAPGGRFKNTRDHVEKGCFSRSVRPDQTSDGPLCNLQRRAINGVESTEMLVKILHDDHLCTPGLNAYVHVFLLPTQTARSL